MAAEAHRMDRARDNPGAEVRQRHRHAADLQRRPAEGVVSSSRIMLPPTLGR